MKNKKLAILALILGIIGTMGFAACGGKESGATSSGNSSGSSESSSSVNDDNESSSSINSSSENASSENGGNENSSSINGGNEEVQGETLVDEATWKQVLQTTAVKTNAVIAMDATMETRSGEYFMKQTGVGTMQLADGKMYQRGAGTYSYHYPDDYDGTVMTGEDEFETETYTGIVDDVVMEWSRPVGEESWDCYPLFDVGFDGTVGSTLMYMEIPFVYFSEMYAQFQNVNGTYILQSSEEGSGGRVEMKFVNGLLYSLVWEVQETLSVDVPGGGTVVVGIDYSYISLVLTYDNASVGDLPPMTWDGESGGDVDGPDRPSGPEDCVHSFSEYYPNYDGTCREDGTKTAYCLLGCGETDTIVDEGSKVDHSFTDYVSNDDATCTGDGTKTAWCDYGCNETDTVTDEGSKLEHSFTYYESNYDATCTEDGTKTATCDNDCGEKETVADEGSKLGHSFKNYKSNDDATCEEDGTKTANCENGCGETKTVTDEGTAGHDYVDGVCDDCGQGKVSEGLVFSLNDDASSYSVTGKGVCKDTEIFIPSTYKDLPVTGIGIQAFDHASDVTKIVVPDSVTSIGERAFNGCTNLIEITLPFLGRSRDATNGYDQRFGYIFAYGKGTQYNFEGAGILQYSGYGYYYHYYFPKSLKKVTVTGEICSNAFQNCSMLTEVEIADSVTSIGDSAFSGCSGLQYEIKGGLKYLGNDNNPYLYLVGVETKDITSATIEKTCKFIASHAFNNCSGLIKIEIPEGVKSIGGRAFGECSGLTKIVIPDSVMRIGEYAFNNCNSLQYTTKDGLKYLGNDNNPYLYLAKAENTDITSVTIENTCKVIGDSAFYKCSKLTEIAIPEGVVSIGISAFSECSKLAKIVIPDSVTSIGASAFYNCSNLTEVTIPYGVKNIAEKTFGYCSKLTKVIIPDSVTSIGAYALYFSGISEIVIPENLTNIGDYGLNNCRSLKSITFKGTMGQWGNITKGSYWKISVPTTTVVCSDGEAAL